jgi:hypothetical protein
MWINVGHLEHMFGNAITKRLSQLRALRLIMATESASRDLDCHSTSLSSWSLLRPTKAGEYTSTGFAWLPMPRSEINPPLEEVLLPQVAGSSTWRTPKFIRSPTSLSHNDKPTSEYPLDPIGLLVVKKTGTVLLPYTVLEDEAASPPIHHHDAVLWKDRKRCDG